MSETEGDDLGDFEMKSLVEDHVEIDMDSVARGGVQGDVFSVPVAQADQVAHHRHDSCGPGEGQACHQPRLRVGLKRLKIE